MKVLINHQALVILTHNTQKRDNKIPVLDCPEIMSLVIGTISNDKDSVIKVLRIALLLVVNSSSKVIG